MERFIPIHLNGGDENSTHFNFLKSENGKHQNRFNGGAIRLRDLNTGADRPPSQRTVNLVTYLRKPDPTVGPSVKLQGNFPEIGDLGEVQTKYIPESPSLLRTLAHSYSTNSSPVTKLMRINDTSLLDLTSVSKIYDDGFDCQPFYHIYDYENRLEADDYESILHQMVEDELNNQRPVFEREMEYQELKKMVGFTDYILHYLFGIDKLQFFQLKEERDKFQEYTYESYTRPLNYPEIEGEEEEEEEECDVVYEEDETNNMLRDTSSVMSIDEYV